MVTKLRPSQPLEHNEAYDRSCMNEDDEELETIELPETDDDRSKIKTAHRVSESRSAFADKETRANAADEKLEIEIPETDNYEDCNVNDRLEVPATPENPSQSYDEAESVFNFQEHLSQGQPTSDSTEEFAKLRRCVIVRERSLIHRLAGKEFYFLFLETPVSTSDRCEDHRHSLLDDSRSKQVRSTPKPNSVAGLNAEGKSPNYELLLIAKRDRRKEKVKIYDVCKEVCPKTESLIDIVKDNVANVEASTSGSFFVYDCFDQALTVQYERSALTKRLGEGFVPRAVQINLYPADRLQRNQHVSVKENLVDLLALSHSSMCSDTSQSSSYKCNDETNTDSDASSGDLRLKMNNNNNNNNNDDDDNTNINDESNSSINAFKRETSSKNAQKSREQDGVSFFDVNSAQATGSAHMEYNKRIAKRLSYHVRKQKRSTPQGTKSVHKENGIDPCGIQGLVTLVNRSPRFERGQYRLNFHGRVKRASSKNMQIIERKTAPAGNICENLVMQFGKVSSHRFTLDFQQPLSSISAFGIALTQFL